MKAAVVVFPGSNCDRDCKVAVERSTGATVEMVWHGDSELPAGLDLIVLPGGFSYGDYLRCGAMAALSPVMAPVKAAGSLAAGNITFADYGAQIVSRSSSQTATNKTDLQLQSDLKSSLELKQSQVSGVNLDEEMSQLMIYQNSYAASAKVIATTKSLFDILNNLIN